MKVIYIEHDRCNEYDKHAFYLAPDTMSADDIDGAIQRAQDAYLKAFHEAPQLPEPPYRGNNILDTDQDSTTIGEIRAQYKASTDIRDQNRKNKQLVAVSFEHHLAQQGIIILDRDTAEERHGVYWGHKHGANLIYGQTKEEGEE
jgi:hypothetical protein